MKFRTALGEVVTVSEKGAKKILGDPRYTLIDEAAEAAAAANAQPSESAPVGEPAKVTPVEVKPEVKSAPEAPKAKSAAQPVEAAPVGESTK